MNHVIIIQVSQLARISLILFPFIWPDMPLLPVGPLNWILSQHISSWFMCRGLLENFTDEPDMQDTAGEARNELISDVLLWTPTHGCAKAGRPARTYIQQLCEDTGCCPEDLPRAMNDREEWRERVRDIRATSAIWWWWHMSSSLFLQ